MPVELGVSLPTAGRAPSAAEVARAAAAAEELGFDSVWASDHVVVGPDGTDDYSQVLDPFSALAWVAARHQRLALGTSVVVLPIHHPIEVAQRAATLQHLSGGRFRLGVGVGWHQPEFEFLGYDFHDRGQRADEELDLIQALWAGQGDFDGKRYRLRGARSGPRPEPPPEIWVGGNGAAARRRARERGAVWHPIAPAPEDIRAAVEGWPESRVVPRVRVRFGRHEGHGLQGSPHEITDQARALLDAGCAGLVLTFVPAPAGDRVADMDTFAREVAPALRS